MALLTYEQQQAIKPISANNSRRYVQLEKEIEDIYLPRLLGYELAQLVQTSPDNYKDLLDGSSFEYCGINYRHKGLRYCLAYYLYAEYINQSDIEDTFTGIVRQNRGETEHISGGRIQQLQDYYIKITSTAFEIVKKYIDYAGLIDNSPIYKTNTPKLYTISNPKSPKKEHLHRRFDNNYWN